MSIDEAILASVAAQSGQAYGVTILRDLATAGHNVSLGEIYARLDRMEKEGLVESTVLPASKERGWHQKKVFNATGKVG